MAADLHFSLSDIKELTLTQLSEFQRAIARKKIEEVKVMSLALRVSALGDKDSYADWIETLSKPIDFEPKKIEQKKTVEYDEDFDWKKDDKQGIVASNVSEDYLKNYLKNAKDKELPI